MSSIVVVIFLGMLNLGASVIDIASVYVGQVNFEDVLSNVDEGENLQQLDDVFSGFINGSGSQLREEPTQLVASAQAAAQSFVGRNVSDSEVSFPDFDDLTGNLSGFGFTKGYMEIVTPKEQIPLVDSLLDVVLIN